MGAYRNRWRLNRWDIGSSEGESTSYLGFEKDQGHYHAMNKGVARATGEIVAILNSDDCYRPHALRKVGEAFVKHPDWDGAFGDVVFMDGKGEEIYSREEAVFDYNVLRFSGICYVSHPTLFVKKSVYDRLGDYRHRDFLNSADFEFILRLGRENAESVIFRNTL